MRTTKKTFLLVLLSISATTFAKGDGLMRHGGVGFLFEDASGFSNPAYRGRTKGAALQADYTRFNSDLQSLTPSFILGSGKFAIGMFSSRLGPTLTAPETSTDSIGGDLGLAFANDRLGMGIGYVRSIDAGQDGDGKFLASIKVSGQRSTGFNVSVLGTTTVNRATRDINTGTFGIGYGFVSGGIEASYAVTDFKDPQNNYKMLGAFNVEGKTVYFGAGFGYEKPVNASIAVGRFGVKYKTIDFSLHLDHQLVSGYTPAYGGTFRMTL